MVEVIAPVLVSVVARLCVQKSCTDNYVEIVPGRLGDLLALEVLGNLPKQRVGDVQCWTRGETAWAYHTRTSRTDTMLP